MKHILKAMILMVALIIGGTSRILADDLTLENVIVKKVPADVYANDVITFTAGDVSVSVDGRTATLTVTPSSGYFVKKSMITAIPMVAANAAPRRSSLLGALTVNGDDDEVSYQNSGTYTISVDDIYTGAYVTVSFYKKTEGFEQVYSLNELKTKINANPAGIYELMCDIVAPSNFESINNFTGTFDGGLHTIMNLSEPLFKTVDGAIIRNVILDKVSITSGDEDGDAGAICCKAEGASRIYNCGILEGSVSGSRYVGSLVGLLNHSGEAGKGSRVINCYSYADVGGGTDVGGFVGYNNFASLSSDIRTMVMNCMFYGNITSGTNISPIYGGEIIHNANVDGDNTNNGLNNYNYYRYESNFSKNNQITSDKYNCALAAEERYLVHFEQYRLLLNSNRKLAAWYATGSAANAGQMAKWVLETADRTITNPMPYPILKAQGKYPSIINYDDDHVTDLTSSLVNNKPREEDRNKGGKLGSLDVAIEDNTSGKGSRSGSFITTGSKTLPITDKDFDKYNYNYYKVRLPYYNEVGSGNYTKATGEANNKVVTGWIITSMTGATQASAGEDITYNADGTVKDIPYNFADRTCTKFDNGDYRVFSQGAYFDVPIGVTAITIKPYWANAAFLSDNYLDKTYEDGTRKYTNNQGKEVVVDAFGNYQNVTATQYNNNTSYTINGISGKVYTSISNALGAITKGATVYDNAIVLVGNFHQYGVPYYNKTDPATSNPSFTIMSADFDNDNEPDFSLIYNHIDRKEVAPIRFDFINIPGTAMAQKPYGSTKMCGIGTFKPLGWFEVTNTTLIHFGQFEYDYDGKQNAPLILLGGEVDQITSNNSVSDKGSTNAHCTDHTQYFLVGSNVWFKEFNNGIHADKKHGTPHRPISVTGGRYEKFYLSGIYQPSLNYLFSDDAECYISGGSFGEVAGAGQEKIDGDVNWIIDYADIDNFYGGGINAANAITGDINVTIKNSHVDVYCGGPKFGNMTGWNTESTTDDKTVKTNADGCVFRRYFGAGYGGASYNKVRTQNLENNQPWSSWQGNYTSNRGKYVSANKGIATGFEYEYFIGSKGTIWGRFYVNYASFSKAITNNVYSNLTGCHITDNFYGGGSLGVVNGTAYSTLNGCTVDGSVYGGGYSASVPTVDVVSSGFSTLPSYNSMAGLFISGVLSASAPYKWKTGTLSNNSSALDTDTDGKDVIYTDQDLTNLGQVKTTNLTIDDNTTVAGSVYGGGEESAVDGNTTVNVNSGSIGTEGHGNAEHGNVFGGGNLGVVEKSTNVTISGGSVHHSVYGGGCEADVKGNTNVTMTGGYIFNGIFGGGYSGSVGTVTARELVNYDGKPHAAHTGCVGGKPTAFEKNTGKCTVVVTGGQIGPIEVATKGMKRSADEGGPVPEGWVWGGGCGVVADPETDPDADFRTYVDSTDVTIGGDAFILESIIGGGEFGRVHGSTHVTIQENCQIGVGYQQVDGDNKPKRYANEKFVNPATTTITNDNALTPCSHYDYNKDNPLPYDLYYDDASEAARIGQASTANPSDGKTWIGCVFGGGSGYMPYKKKDGTGYGWLRSAGVVEGNTLVEIKGGHILTNVYGGNEVTDVNGKCTVKMTGGTIGVPRTLDQIKANPFNGNLYGAGKGDPRTYFNEFTNVGSVEVDVSGGIIYGSVYGGGEDGHVTGNVTTTIRKEAGEGKVAPVIGCDGTSGEDGNVFGAGQGSTVSLTSGVVSGNVTLNIQDGDIKGSVYGGGQIGSVGTNVVAWKIEDPNNSGQMIVNPLYGKMKDGNDHGCLTVNLKGGTIHQNVYGGCMGTTADVAFGVSKNVTLELNKDVDDDAQGCAVVGSIFGCNNVNSSPEGTVSVHIHGTQNALASQIAGTVSGENAVQPKEKDRYDVKAVYGGGNMAAYIPKNLTTGTTNVIIDGCGRTSIQQVYGGGNAASTPATYVEVNGTYEIEEVFGGGNGEADIVKDGVTKPNPGANVGYKDYSEYYQENNVWKVRDKADADTKEERLASNYKYGTGKASVNIFGGTVHRVFGGSNTKGNVCKTAVTMLEEANSCDFCVDEAYGGGKSAPMDAEAKLLMACIPGLSAAYGGAEAADIQGNVTLNITNGTFDRVFGGNNKSGTISGSITVNISEVGCKPIIIGELYGGGNLAGYSVYGYNSDKSLKESGTQLYCDPQVNVKSFTSIGTIYGGGYGENAVMVGNPTVNIDVVNGAYYDDDKSVIGDDAKTPGKYPIPSHEKEKIGAINNVFGGGNAAMVKGDTHVNIGTSDVVYEVATPAPTSENFASGTYYVLDGEGTPSNPYKYVSADTTFDADKTYYVEKPVLGVDIRGNVYGGGNNAEVTGNTNVTIGKENTTTSTTTTP